MSAPDIGIAVVDGRDALAIVIIRRTDDGIAVDAHANGISKRAAADVLREVASHWDDAS